MLYKTHKKNLVLLLIIFMVLFSGCSKDEDTANGTATQNEGSSNNEANQNDSSENTSNESSQNESSNKTEHYKIYAERKLLIDITAPFEISNNYITKVITAQNGSTYADVQDKEQIIYTPNNGFIGEDTFSYKVYRKNTTPNENELIEIKYIIDIEKAPLEGNRDYIITQSCEDSPLNIDIDIVDNDLNLINKFYDDIEQKTYIPRNSRIQVDYQGIEDEVSKKHHDTFLQNKDNNLLITCNYSQGYKSIFIPISSENWYANRPHWFSNRHFDRNDIFFYISYLSDLYTKIYLKEYQYSNNFEESMKKAGQFLEQIFPSTHYKEELSINYNTYPHDPVTSGYNPTLPYNGSMHQLFPSDNQNAIDILYNLSQELTNTNIFKVVDKIANNYESFYLSENKKCLDTTICASFFPEYTKSVTTNSTFDDGFNGWKKDEQIYDIASGKSEYIPLTSEISLELMAKIPNNTEEPVSYIELSQTEKLNNNTIDDYLLRFDINAWGGADGGFAGAMCTSSSGFTGAYALFRDKDDNQIGLLAWTDHCNKFDYAWSGRNGIDSTDKFYNVRLRNVLRRIEPSLDTVRFEYTANIGEMTKKYLPLVYSEKDKIDSIEYGVFLTEHRNSDNGCYYCIAKIKANEINLLKIIK